MCGPFCGRLMEYCEFVLVHFREVDIGIRNFFYQRVQIDGNMLCGLQINIEHLVRTDDGIMHDGRVPRVIKQRRTDDRSCGLHFKSTTIVGTPRSPTVDDTEHVIAIMRWQIWSASARV